MRELQITMLSKTSWTQRAHSHASVNDEFSITERWYSTAVTGNRGGGEKWCRAALWDDSRFKQFNTSPSFQEGVRSPTPRINVWCHRTAYCLGLITHCILLYSESKYHNAIHKDVPIVLSQDLTREGLFPLVWIIFKLLPALSERFWHSSPRAFGEACCRFGHSDECAVVPHWCFSFACSWCHGMWRISYVFSCHLCIFFGDTITFSDILL